jgi:hypothetical protein
MTPKTEVDRPRAVTASAALADTARRARRAGASYDAARG